MKPFSLFPATLASVGIFALILSGLFSSAAAHADVEVAPKCDGVHVWYSLINDSKTDWSIQISQIYENNISFVDEQCQKLDFSKKIDLSPNQLRYVGMRVDTPKGFSATYSFFGVQTGPNSGTVFTVPRQIPACGFFVAPYAPAQMDRMDWNLNNGDCYSQGYGTEMHFR